MNSKKLQQEQIKYLAEIKRFHIPIGCGHPTRDHAITQDEITNLKIELGLSEDSQEFEQALPESSMKLPEPLPF